MTAATHVDAATGQHIILTRAGWCIKRGPAREAQVVVLSPTGDRITVPPGQAASLAEAITRLANTPLRPAV